jgi:hypothetical protein
MPFIKKQDQKHQENLIKYLRGLNDVLRKDMRDLKAKRESDAFTALPTVELEKLREDLKISGEIRRVAQADEKYSRSQEVKAKQESKTITRELADCKRQVLSKADVIKRLGETNLIISEADGAKQRKISDLGIVIRRYNDLTFRRRLALAFKTKEVRKEFFTYKKL